MNLNELRNRFKELDAENIMLVKKFETIKKMLTANEDEKRVLSEYLKIVESKPTEEVNTNAIKLVPKEEPLKFKDRPVSSERETELDNKIKEILG